MSASANVAASPARVVNPWLIAVVVALASFMEVLDTTIANVALRYVAGGLGVTLVPRLAVAAGITAGTDVELRKLEGACGWRTISLAWRPHSPRAEEYRALLPLIAAAAETK